MLAFLLLKHHFLQQSQRVRRDRHEGHQIPLSDEKQLTEVLSPPQKQVWSPGSAWLYGRSPHSLLRLRISIGAHSHAGLTVKPASQILTSKGHKKGLFTGLAFWCPQITETAAIQRQRPSLQRLLPHPASGGSPQRAVLNKTSHLKAKNQFLLPCYLQGVKQNTPLLGVQGTHYRDKPWTREQAPASVDYPSKTKLSTNWDEGEQECSHQVLWSGRILLCSSSNWNKRCCPFSRTFPRDAVLTVKRCTFSLHSFKPLWQSLSLSKVQ